MFKSILKFLKNPISGILIFFIYILGLPFFYLDFFSITEIYIFDFIIVTSLILSAGFMTLILSNFNGTFYTGLLVSLTLVFAVLADLLLIPILLVYFYTNKKSSS